MAEKTYRVYVPDPNKFLAQHGQEAEVELADEDTGEHFKARIVTSGQAQPGYDKLSVQSKGVGSQYHWECYVQIVERPEEEEEAGTIFRGGRLGQRRGYMLESMIQERADKKKDVMTTQLEERLKRKQEVVKSLREEQKKKE